MIDLSDWSARCLGGFESRLADTFADARPPAFREACRYPLATGGKRMRPLLAFAAAEAVGAPIAAAMDAAVAVELLHTYSLVHDDLPCMDDDDLRRGRPTVHRQYGEAVAVLVGDALQTEAFRTIAAHAALIAELAAASGAAGMIAGQFLDIAGGVTTVEQLLDLHRQKTGALIRAAVRMGGLAAGAEPPQLDALGDYGDAVGLAFQVHDDLLDGEQDAGGDGPPNFVKLVGRDAARAEADRLRIAALAAAARLPHPHALVALARFAVERTR